jgi:putative hydrolase of the HAD superfamily
VRTIEWVFLDLGNVLYALDSEGVLNRFAARCGKTPLQLSEALHDQLLMQSYDSGAISSETFFNNAHGILDCDIDFDEFRSIWNSLLIPKKCMFRLAARLKRKVNLLILSNTNEIHASFVDPAVRTLTDKVIYSYQVGCMKPEEEIYRKALSLSGSPPEKALFIDDRIENIRGAASLGINTHHFRDRKTLCKVFREYGL